MEQWINNVLSSNGIMQPTLRIEDLNKLKITKIRTDKIYFKYDNIRYFIIAHRDCEGDQWCSLYRKQFIYGRWRVEQISSSGWNIVNIRIFLDKETRSKRNYIYSHIDKEYFVDKLKENNLIEV